MLLPLDVDKTIKSIEKAVKNGRIPEYRINQSVEKIINAKFNSSDLNISFNSRYLIDIASQIESEKIFIYLKDPGSPVLVKDPAEKNSFHVVMPMKI